MKKILLIVFFQTLVGTAYACPNLSGEYFNEAFGTYYSINQESCELIQFVYDEGIIDAPIDGVEYTDNEYDIIVEEGKVLAHVIINSSRSFKENKLITKEHSIITYADGKSEEERSWSEKYLNKDSDLVTVDHSGNKKTKIVEKRVNSPK